MDERTFDRPSACMTAPFDSTNIKMKRIQRQLHRPGGEEATRKHPSWGTLCHQILGGWDFWKARKSFLQPVIKGVKVDIR